MIIKFLQFSKFSNNLGIRSESSQVRVFEFHVKRNIEELGQYGKGIITNGKQILLFKNMEIKEEAFYDDLNAYRPNWYFWPGQNFESKSNPVFVKDEMENYRIVRMVSTECQR